MRTSTIERTFPDVQALDLDGKPVRTADFRGEPTVFLLGFTYASRFEVEGWAEFFDSLPGPRIRYVEMPVYSGIWTVLRTFVDRRMAAATPAALHGRVLTTVQRDELVLALGLDRPESGAAVVLTDAGGHVRFLARGPCTAGTDSEFLEALHALENGA